MAGYLSSDCYNPHRDEITLYVVTPVGGRSVEGVYDDYRFAANQAEMIASDAGEPMEVREVTAKVGPAKSLYRTGD